jgi:predicted TIM-barrel enzyme
MGFNQPSSSAAVAVASKASSVSKTDLFGAVLAGFGIWTTSSPKLTTAKPQASPSNVFPLRVIRVKEALPNATTSSNPQKMAGRMVISGRMADVCAELDRLAA